MLGDVDRIKDILDEQRNYDDIFITKYGDDETISTVILDFDGADHKEEVYKEVLTIHHFLKHKGLNSVIVSSTNKGYHFYIQVPSVCFNESTVHLGKSERNRLFVMFTENLIHQKYFKFKSLDYTNTNAGLGGNIRLLGSMHPKTHKMVHIVLGEFLDLSDEEVRSRYYDRCSHYVQMIYKSTLKQYQIKNEMQEEKILRNKRKRLMNKGWKDPIKENDLRELLPSLYGGTVKKYGTYIFMQCPWHTDRKPSCKVTKEWFYCTGCGKKGNIWTLIKEGEFEL